MSWDDDYMSDKFIQELEKAEELNKSKLNKLPGRKKLCTRPEPQQGEKPKNIMEKNRDEGLAKTIPSTNKGFVMLAKMGYKPGQGIGKEASGISEPIGIDVKNDRKGFGKRRSNAEIMKEFQERLAARMNQDSVESFRSRLAEEKMKKFVEIDLSRSQKVCKQFDEDETIEEPEETWFWPEVKDEEEEEEEYENEDKDEEEESIEESVPVECKLEVLTEYLRFKHLYCIWCAVKYNDIEDLQENCPGNTRNDH